jgi:signal transduction histidine kinase
MLNPITIFKEVKASAGKDDRRKIIAIFGLALATVALNLFFLPAPLGIFNVLAFVLIFALAAANYEHIVRFSSENKVKNLELETVIQNIRDGILVYDTNFRILSLNKSAEKIFGISAEEVLGIQMEPEVAKNPHLRVITQVIFPSLAPVMNVISDSGWPQIIDVTLEDPHLELRTVLNRIMNDRNEVVGFLKLVTDTTREKGILESKTEFISVAAHQLRTPLTALNWSFETLNKVLGEKSPDMKEVTSLAKEGWQLTERSLKIVNDLLNAARIEGGRFGFNFEEVNLMDFLRTMVKQAEPVAREYGIKVNLSDTGREYRVRIDQELLGIAVANILDNGMKYNVKNGVISIEEESDSTNKFVRISIKDTGVGIPAEELGKMFEKFYRGTNVVQLEPNGSGLGLYITKNIIEGHGGKITVESQIERGTVFSFTLPLDFGLIPSQTKS